MFCPCLHILGSILPPEPRISTLSTSQNIWKGHRATSRYLDAGKGSRGHLTLYLIFTDEETKAPLCSVSEAKLWSYACQPWLLYWIAVWPWSRHLTSLRISFIICKKGASLALCIRWDNIGRAPCTVHGTLYEFNNCWLLLWTNERFVQWREWSSTYQWLSQTSNSPHSSVISIISSRLPRGEIAYGTVPSPYPILVQGAVFSIGPVM